MCGICGIVTRQSLSPVQLQALRAANGVMAHRGPDGPGEYLDAGTAGDPHRSQAFLAMHRLSIVDIPGGWQPQLNEDRSLALIANAEIYNYRELRAQLIATGRHRFSTHSDCEVILHLYEEYGLDFVAPLRGMFAFALWDSRCRRLVLGRDRMGEKPLYYSADAERFVFASEMKGIVATKLVGFELNPAAVHDYLHFGWVPEPATMVKGVRKVEAGTLITVDVDDWTHSTRRYWNFDDAPPVHGDAATLIRSELDSVMDLVIPSDIAVGVALSGGLDSSIVATMASRIRPDNTQAFSVGYAGRHWHDERAWARKLARDLHMPMDEIEISTADMAEAFPRLNYWRDDPIADIAGYGYYLLGKAAREKGCPILLQGQGADELLWGYPWTIRAVEYTQRKRDGRGMSMLQELLAVLPRGPSRMQLVPALYAACGVCFGWKKFGLSSTAPASQVGFYDMVDTFQIGRAGAPRTYTPAFAQSVRDHVPEALFRIDGDIENVRVLIIKLLCQTYLLSNGIAQGDRLSMANSVELRLPLIDYKLVELIVGLHKGGHPNPDGKAWLKDATRDLLPAEVLTRPKRGFNPPVTEWTEALRARYGNVLQQGYLASKGVLDPQAAVRLASRGPRFDIWNNLFFKYLSLELWCQQMATLQSAA